MTTTPSPVTKANNLVIRGMLLLLHEIMAAEGRARQAENLSPAPEGKAAEVVAELKAMETDITPAIDALMAERIMAGRRRTPLLQPTDTDRILAKVFTGEQMDGETSSAMSITRVVLDTAIASRINFLRAINEDLYDAFWTFAQALASEAASSRSLPSQVVELRGGRIAVYRACMTPESWRLRTQAIVTLMTNAVSATKLFGGLVSSIQDDDASSMLSAMLSDVDAASTSSHAANARRVRAYYTKLGREIWPTVR